MVDIAPALARLQLVIDQSDGLQRGPHRRQDGLLSLEMGVRDITADRTTGRVIDQAEDIRRAVKGHTTGQLAEIREAPPAPTRRSSQPVERSMPSDFARMLGHLVNSAGEEARWATIDLHDVDQALSRVSQALPGESRLAQSAQESIDHAASASRAPAGLCFEWSGSSSHHPRHP